MRRKVYLVGMDGMMYPMYQKFAQEGVLPNLKRLADNGMVTEVYTSLPAYTPTNWATIMTGAHTGTHGILRWYVDLPNPKGTEKTVNSFVGNVVKAETIFEAAARAGLKSVAFHYPATSPRPAESLYVIDGFASPAFGASPFEVTPALVYTTTPGISRTCQIELAPAQGWTNLPLSHLPHLEFSLPLVIKQSGEERIFYGLVVDTTGSGYDTVIICSEKNGNTKIASSQMPTWSDWCQENFVVLGKPQEATFRFKTLELAPDGSKISLYRSQVMMVDEFCEPKELGRELVDRFGPFQEHASPFPYKIGAADLETCLQEMEYQAQWVARAGRYMMEAKDCHLFYCQIHIFDYINHTHLFGVDPASPAHDPAKAEEYWQLFRQCYIQADQMLGTILDRLDEDSCIIVLSDHAIAPDRRAINMRKFLYQNGFLALKDASKGLDRDEAPEENIDWQKTKVFMKPGRGYDIFINAQEGSPDYLKIQQDLIRLLRTWVDNDTGCCPVAIALRKKDAPLLGFWGDQCGDVVFINEDGYAHGYLSEWGGIKGGGYIGEPLRYGAHHGPQLPTSRTQVASNMGFLLVNGAGIKQGYERPVQELGYIHMTSIVPLICHLLEIEPPAQCQGSLPRDILKDKAATAERRSNYPEWEPSTSPTKKEGHVWVQADMFDFVDHTDNKKSPRSAKQK